MFVVAHGAEIFFTSFALTEREGGNPPSHLTPCRTVVATMSPSDRYKHRVLFRNSPGAAEWAASGRSLFSGAPGSGVDGRTSTDTSTSSHRRSRRPHHHHHHHHRHQENPHVQHPPSHLLPQVPQHQGLSNRSAAVHLRTTSDDTDEKDSEEPSGVGSVLGAAARFTGEESSSNKSTPMSAEEEELLWNSMSHPDYVSGFLSRPLGLDPKSSPRKHHPQQQRIHQGEGPPFHAVVGASSAAPVPQGEPRSLPANLPSTNSKALSSGGGLLPAQGPADVRNGHGQQPRNHRHNHSPYSSEASSFSGDQVVTIKNHASQGAAASKPREDKSPPESLAEMYPAHTHPRPFLRSQQTPPSSASALPPSDAAKTPPST